MVIAIAAKFAARNFVSTLSSSVDTGLREVASAKKFVSGGGSSGGGGGGGGCGDGGDHGGMIMVMMTTRRPYNMCEKGERRR